MKRNLCLRLLLLFTAISGFFCVVFGAIGSHMLANTLNEQQLQWIETGLRYQMFHTAVLFALLALLLNEPNRLFVLSGIAFVVGIVLFSGSLYLLPFFQWDDLFYVTPIGGLSFLVGWLCVIIRALRFKDSNATL